MIQESELIHEANDDLLDDLNDDQLAEYKSMLKQLGAFPDKVLINTLSMIAEDYSISYPESCNNIYIAIRDLLLSKDVKPDCKLPLVYVIDSILKNAKGLYIEIMQQDIQNWMGTVYQMLQGSELARVKLRRVWNTWNEFHIFSHDDWKQMGKCFTDEDEKAAVARKIADAKTKAAGIDRAPDGSLLLGSKLRKHMQAVLDDVQAEDTDELSKVSLERLADINPDLLVEIKKAAEDIMDQERMAGMGHESNPIALDGAQVEERDALRRLFPELQSPEWLKRSSEWEKVNLDCIRVTNETIKKLFQNVRMATNPDKPLAQSDFYHLQGVDVMKLLGSASAAASTLTQMLERHKLQTKNKGLVSFTAGPLHKNIPAAHPSFYRNAITSAKAIDKTKFTTEGLKEKNDAVIARLYDGGLPFVCSADGRRFATQIDHSRHLDELFRRSQLEKTMDRTDERKWYPSISVWCGRMKQTDGGNTVTSSVATDEMNNESDIVDPNTCLVSADESRDKCAICGISFNMQFDQDEGEWKYSNCKEIEVLNDDVAEQESEHMLVHVTCLRGLGSPQVLTIDQILQI
jgi:pre-mRNA cleavage complex 2 protein Pcf11